MDASLLPQLINFYEQNLTFEYLVTLTKCIALVTHTHTHIHMHTEFHTHTLG